MTVEAAPSGRRLRPPVPALVRENVPFRRFFAGQAVSRVGEQITLIAPRAGIRYICQARPVLASLLATARINLLNFVCALAGGPLGSAVGSRATLWIASAGAVAGVLWLLPSPVLRMRVLPEVEELL